MPTEAAVLEALRPVEDPELHQSIVDLDMVKEVADQPGALALISFAASKLWELRDRQFTKIISLAPEVI